MSFTKSEPPQMGFLFLAQPPLPPCVPLNCVDPGPEPGSPHLNQPLIIQIQASPHVVREIQALTASFSIFSPKQWHLETFFLFFSFLIILIATLS